jgi:glycosyltransferase involved in cell wall biosynthesis
MTASHIALVLHDFPPGGSERIAIRLANRWARYGRRVTLLCGTEKGIARSLVAPDVTVESCTPDTPRTPWSRIQLGWRLANLVRKHRPDVVFGPGNFHLIILAFLARRPFETRPVFVCKLSNPIRRAGIRHFVGTLADRAIERLAAPVDALTVMSTSLAVEAHAVFRNHDVTTINEPVLEDDLVIGNGRDPDMSAPFILCAGRLNTQKDFVTAIRAFALVDAPDLRLVILGEGPLRRALEGEIQRLGLSKRVDLPGHVADIGPWLARARLFLLSSRYEGYPAVLVEAIAAGVPIVTTNCTTALSEILIDTSLGSITASRKPADIAGAISAMLAKPMPDLAVSARLAERHRMAHSAAAYLDLFDRLTS